MNKYIDFSCFYLSKIYQYLINKLLLFSSSSILSWWLVYFLILIEQKDNILHNKVDEQIDKKIEQKNKFKIDGQENKKHL